jgi:hypothetical protein
MGGIDTGGGGFSGSSAATSGDSATGDKRNGGFNVNYGAAPWYAYAFGALVVGGLMYVVITK